MEQDSVCLSQVVGKKVECTLRNGETITDVVIQNPPEHEYQYSVAGQTYTESGHYYDDYDRDGKDIIDIRVLGGTVDLEKFVDHACLVTYRDRSTARHFVERNTTGEWMRTHPYRVGVVTYTAAGRSHAIPEHDSFDDIIGIVSVGGDTEDHGGADGGMKFDGGKPRPSLLLSGMPVAIERVIDVLEYGAQKYAADSWRTVPNATERYKEALLRHTLAMAEEGVNSVDGESGKQHLAHIVCNALFLMELQNA